MRGFYNHAAAYGVGITAMAAINVAQGFEPVSFIWPALGWGIGLASHGVSTFEFFSLFGPDWERRQVDRRLGRRN
ncbi:MAG: 2TM domain-containing protein [Pseudomonadota bacterium]